jgi:hypothetical protein
LLKAFVGKSSLRKSRTCQHETTPPAIAPRTLSQLGLTTRRLAQDGVARATLNNGRCVREDGGDLEASGALDVHEERSGRLDKLLQLVLSGLSFGGRVEEIDGENLRGTRY